MAQGPLGQMPAQDARTRVQRQTDVLDPDRASALWAALGQSRQVAAGDALPPFFHQIYFWDAQPPEALGRDGHPKVGSGLIPDLGLPRRMWAGGRLRFHAPLRAGQQADKFSWVDKVQRKTGRSGPLGFVTLCHEIRQNGQTCVTEWQDLVYRADPTPDAPKRTPPRARMDETLCQMRGFDATLLFRYSALTFNGHRIHYDMGYAQQVEGYGGLVVHGPLLAQILLLMASKTATPTEFAFRGSAPLMHFEEAAFCQADLQEGTESSRAEMWVRGPDGRQIMSATVTF